MTVYLVPNRAYAGSADEEDKLMPAAKDQKALAELNLQSFAKAWVAQLIELGVTGVRPHEPLHRRGFDRVIDVLDAVASQLYEGGYGKSSILPLLEIVNELRPSAAGDYEGFESALRGLQLTFTSSPNPWYEYVEFPISRTHAESFLDKLPPTVRDITKEAALAFKGDTAPNVLGAAS